MRFVLVVIWIGCLGCTNPPAQTQGEDIPNNDIATTVDTQTTLDTSETPNDDTAAVDTQADVPREPIDDDMASVFDDDRLRTYVFTLPKDDWDNLKATALDEEYTEATLHVDGNLVGQVGLRFKGAFGSLTLCFDREGNQTCPKLSMKAKFDKYDDDLRFHGLKRLNFHSMGRDPSLLRDRLAYQIFRMMDVHAPRAVHARVQVNDEELGLFALIEQIDGRFTHDRFRPIDGGGDGNLYKEVWPIFDVSSYYRQGLKTNEETATHDAMVAFHQALNAASEDELVDVLDTWMDLDYAARFLAADRGILNWDGIMAWYCTGGGPCENHNYYWYQEEVQNRFWLIPWDLDHTFDSTTYFDHVPSFDEPLTDCDARYLVFGFVDVQHAACDPLIRGLAQLPPELYLSAIDRLLAEPLDVARMEAELDRWSAQIEPIVEIDTRGPSVSRWKAEVNDLKAEIRVLRQRMEDRAAELRALVP